MLDLHKPTLDELWFRESLMVDSATMSYNHNWGGTIPFPKEEWAQWYQNWLEGSEYDRDYRYLYDTDHKVYVGEISISATSSSWQNTGITALEQKESVCSVRRQRKTEFPCCMTILPQTILPGSFF